jgi:HlyD family secretion protein
LTRTQYTEDIKVAGMDVERSKAALASAKAQLAYTTINASISGVIGSVSTQEGETVAAGFNAPTFVTIIDLNRLQVDAYVDEVDIGKVKLGQQAIFTVDAFPALEFQGKVKAIYPKAIIQDNVVNYDVVVEIIQSSEGLLRPAMTASVTIMLEGRSNVLAIPAKAVKRERGKNVVYIPVDGKAERHEIKVGFQDGEWIEIVAGLEEGQSVIVEKPSPENERM